MRLPAAALAAFLCVPSIASAVTDCDATTAPTPYDTADCLGRCTVITLGAGPGTALTCGLGAWPGVNFATAVNYDGSSVSVWGTTGSGATTFCCNQALSTGIDEVHLHGGGNSDVFSFQYYDASTSTQYGLEGTTTYPLNRGYMSGKAGNDVLIGSSTNDTDIYYMDELRGDPDNDDICGGEGPNDILDGANGVDMIWEDPATDFWMGIIGGPGIGDECPFTGGGGCEVLLTSKPGICP